MNLRAAFPDCLRTAAARSRAVSPGAFRNIGRDGVADAIVDTMRSAGHTVYESDPFEEKTGVSFGAREVSPHMNRVRMMWAGFREDVIRHFPKAPSSAVDIKVRLRRIDGIYAADAYNSLSIEGYRVDSELIERVREGRWDPDRADRENRDALAARGYWQAFQAVRLTITDFSRERIPARPSRTISADGTGSCSGRAWGPELSARRSLRDTGGFRSTYADQGMCRPATNPCAN